MKGVEKKTKCLKTSDYEQLDQALYVWFRQLREKDVPVTGPVLLEKVNYVYFKATWNIDNHKQFALIFQACYFYRRLDSDAEKELLQARATKWNSVAALVFGISLSRVRKSVQIWK